MVDDSKNAVIYVKWFSALKGYGFAISNDFDGDIFIHFSIVQEFGVDELNVGDIIRCKVTNTDKGYQISKIISIEKNPDINSLLTTMNKKEVFASVKWFNPAKGYGFATSKDCTSDIFIHSSLLQRYGIEKLNPGDDIRLVIVSGHNGHEAIDIIM